MAILQAPGTGFADMGNTTSPLVVLFERDDTIAVPLLSQLRMSGYDVRAARTPVELFGMLGKQLVALVLVDLGNATAGRREFWVALDAQRRGRSLQVMTFRFISPANALDPDFEPAARALADIEVRGIHEFQKVLDGVRQRVPLNGAMPAPGAPGMIPPIGAAYGLPSPFSQPSSPSSPFSQPSVPPYSSNPQHQQNPHASPFAQPLSSSPFAQPVPSNPFADAQGDIGNGSPFAQPYSVNPFSSPSNPSSPSSPSNPPSGASDPRWGYVQGTVASNPFSQPFSQPSQPELAGFQRPELPRFGGQAPASHSQHSQHSQQGQHVVDVWVPPEDDQMTSVVPEAKFQQIERQSHQSQMGHGNTMGQMGAALQEPTSHMPTMPHHSAGYTGTPTERALSTVLVEGAMLTAQKLEALRGIQEMLGGVGMQFKLGELALLFKFLSPDQLLAALLVSRGLVSPQQIASLGRIKQELAATGKDEDLATLLLKFQVLPADQLRALQAEL